VRSSRPSATTPAPYSKDPNFGLRSEMGSKHFQRSFGSTTPEHVCATLGVQLTLPVAGASRSRSRFREADRATAPEFLVSAEYGSKG
jgi:hypothetical protein